MGKYTLGESKEDYLETILMVQEQQGYCRSIDVASCLGFTKASVSIAVKKLEQSKDIYRENDGNLILTEQGMKVARKTLDRHHFLTKLLIEFGVSKRQAEIDACELEHIISDISYAKILEWYSKKEQ